MSLPTDATRRWRLLIIVVNVVCAIWAAWGVSLLVLRADATFFAMLEPLFLGPHPAHPMSDDTRMSQCIGLGLFAGWAVTMAWTYAIVPSIAIREVSRALGGGLVVWYVLDSGGCILSGAGLNVVGNTAYAVVMAIALVALRRAPRAEAPA